MPVLSEEWISCPYCGEGFGILIDDSVAEQEYVEDCQICCRPIALTVLVQPDGEIAVSARSENE
jgi:hypothetical protein